MVLETMRGLPKSCIFAFYNPTKKKVYLSYARNSIKRIASIMSDLRDGTFSNTEMCEDYLELELIVLETSSNKNSLDSQAVFRLHMDYWQNYVEKLGLSYYGKRSVYVQYKPRLTHGFDYEGKKVVFVNLVTKRNDSFIVGVFNKTPDAKEFVSTYLDSQGSYILPVYSYNDLTKGFMKFERSRLVSRMNVRS